MLPGESDGQRSLTGYSPWGRKEPDMTEATLHTHTHCHTSKKNDSLSVIYNVEKI